jgi:amino acid permease
MYAFSALGFVIAYFLSQGISADSGANSMIQYVSASLISLVTAGIAYLEERDQSHAGAPRTGMVAFLLTCVICYQTLFFQQTYIWPESR